MFALSLLFAASAMLAIASIALGWRPYARRIALVRQELAACPETRELRFRVVEFGAARGSARVHVLPLRRRVVPDLPEELRAAA